MKKLFYLLLALPLVFAACEPDTNEQIVEKEAVLTITSEATMNFDAEGGEGTITYTAELVEVTREPEALPVVEAMCEAEWVEDLTVAENITFTVAANEADARETKVVVTYGNQSKEVAIKQAAKQNEEPDTINIEASCLVGDYYGDYYCPGIGNYFVYLSDLGFSEDGYAYPGGNYFRLDLYGPLFEGEGDITLPVGTYNLDVDDSMAEWTIGYYYSSLTQFDEAGNAVGGESGLPYSEATLVVTESGATLNATVDGVKYVVTFEGASSIIDAREPEEPTPGEGYSTLTGDIELNLPNTVYALEYYGDYYSGDTDNWMLYIYEDYETLNGAYIMLDFLSDYYADNIAAEYTPTSDSGPYDINTYFTGYVDGDDMWGCWYVDMIEGDMGDAIAPIAGGNIKIEVEIVDDKEVYTITLDCVDDIGNKITGTIVSNPIDFTATALSATPKAKPAKSVANHPEAKSKTLSVR